MSQRARKMERDLHLLKLKKDDIEDRIDMLEKALVKEYMRNDATLTEEDATEMAMDNSY